MKLKNNTYDRLKLIAWVLAPTLTLISALCNIWEVGNADKITATLAALDTFLGAVLTVSNFNYHKEEENV